MAGDWDGRSSSPRVGFDDQVGRKVGEGAKAAGDIAEEENKW